MPGPVGDLGLGTVLGAARLKVLAALPADLAERAALAQQRFHIDAPGWFRSGRNEPHLTDLATAVWEDRRVAITYRHPGETEAVPRTLDPLGLVCKAGTWYLVARRDGELRTYRVSRVQELSVLEEAFDRPDGFALAQFWNESVSKYESSIPSIEVVVAASASAFDRLGDPMRGGGGTLLDHEAMRDGRTRCRVTFDTFDDAYEDLVLLGAEVEVLEPHELRARLVSTAGAMLALYGS